MKQLIRIITAPLRHFLAWNDRRCERRTRLDRAISRAFETGGSIGRG